MSAKPLGIVMATRWEAAPVLRTFGFQKIEKDLYQTEMSGRKVWLCLSGVGREPARQAAYRLCRKGVGELLSAGFCGALTPDLKIGDVVTDRIATTSVPVRTIVERRALADRAGAVAVDMETQAIIEAGTRQGVPIRILRVVSDTVQDDLSPLFGSDGTFSAWRIALRLLNPFIWPAARKLCRNSAVAKAKLVEALRGYLDLPAASPPRA